VIETVHQLMKRIDASILLLHSYGWILYLS